MVRRSAGTSGESGSGVVTDGARDSGQVVGLGDERPIGAKLGEGWVRTWSPNCISGSRLAAEHPICKVLLHAC